MNEKNCTITVEFDGKAETIKCEKGTVLLDALGEQQRAHIDTPCGGKSTCGKCKVKIEGAALSPFTAFENKILSDREKQNGVRLACNVQVEGDIRLILAPLSYHVEIQEDGTEYITEVSPWIKKKYLHLPEPSLEDQRDDLRRLRETIGKPDLKIDLKILPSLPQTIRERKYRITVVHNDTEIINLEPGDTSSENYGIAVDIGTTTVVAYLLNLNTGKRIDALSALNAQKSYGQDVISRINHTIQKEDGLKTLHKIIINQLNEMIQKLARRNGVNQSEIYSCVLAGNTTMIHLAGGLPPKNIANVPFVPVATSRLVYTACDLGLKIAETGKVYLLPCVSGYIGADIVAGLLSCRFTRDRRLNLFIDVGTNGEIVLGNRDGFLCCSTAAGPAFEGAKIRNGMGGVAGAINTVDVVKGELRYTTIAQEKPLGICGSGIIDAMAMLIKYGIVDKTGRFLTKEEIPTREGQNLSSRLIKDDGKPAFILAYEEETAKGDSILITQKDVREIQLAKAAVSAGIKVLMEHAGKSIEETHLLYLAGGFGSYINKNSAIIIGLLPHELRERIIAIGNAAGTGAAAALISEKALRECEQIVSKADYIELSSSARFNEYYINNMYFTHAVR